MGSVRRRRRTMCAGKGRKCRSSATLRKHCKKTKRGKRKSYCRSRKNRRRRMSRRVRQHGGRRSRRRSRRRRRRSRRRRGGFVAQLRRALVPFALYRAQKQMQHRRRRRKHRGSRKSRGGRRRQSPSPPSPPSLNYGTHKKGYDIK